MPAGHREGGEGVRGAAAREVAVVVAVTVAPDDLGVVGVMHRRESDHERIDGFLAARAWSGEPTSAEPARCAELVWAPLDAPPDDTVPYVAQALADYCRGVRYRPCGRDDSRPPSP
ncbi:MAG: hypothetical protein AVDCRST_MAG49-1384 [uncultured Thermomicrobiales bacterium]|uniref:Nudix hydrolase domain-containing protein n=1 Tax=uncultured Thermomicrobiales bacterium TaxID=1645740 RepID=A0A6J4UG82_9BACT|nr:MAG: hypothetical protein AVDCRST_MAG49-1384 [uncultured Thermomicrobiales bacterium]